MERQLQKVVAHLVSMTQIAFQKAPKNIVANTRLAQDIIDYLDEHNLPGLLAFADQSKAYDRVDWEWLHAVLDRAGVHHDFIDLVTLLYSGAEAQLKVNGHVSESVYKPKNGVRQGGPLSTLLYLISFQPFLSLLERSGDFEGIEIPGPLGKGTTTLRATTCADDLMGFLRNADALPEFRRCLCK